MKILALEFSSAERSAAVYDPSSGTETPAEAVETGSRSMRPLELVEGALSVARLEREQIECLAVGLGPGSYTGIRVAISLAQGWQLARNIKLLGISSADCIAAQAACEGVGGRVHVALDAQRKELYIASYEIDGTGARVVEPLRLVSVAEAQRLLPARGAVVGPEVSRWFPDGRLIFPRASTVARIASGRTDFIPGEQMEPIYLRQASFIKAPRPRAIVR